MTLRLEIDELAFHGLELQPADGERVRAALVAELGRLLATGPYRAASERRVVLPGLTLARGQSPEQLATGVAHALQQGLRGMPASPRGGQGGSR